MRIRFFNIIFLILVGCIVADSGEFGVREAGMGLTGTARALDATSLYMNPASAGLVRSNCFTAGYGRLAWGIGNSAIEHGIGSYVFRRKDIGGAGLSFSILNQDVSYYAKVGLTVAPEFHIWGHNIALGLTANWYQTGYRPSNFIGHEAGPDPLFSDATQKNALGLSAGAIANIYKDLWFGLVARDINEPNLALQDTVAYGKRPIELQGGFYYPVHNYFRPSLDLVWRNETINNNRFTRTRVGVEARLPKGFYVRAGYDGTGIDAGLTIHSGSLFGGLDIDYAFVYPVEKDLAEVGAVSHHFAVSIWGIEKRPKKIDLFAENLQPMQKLTAGVDNTIKGSLINIGKEQCDGFSVSLASLDSTGKWRVIYPIKYLDGLAPHNSDSTEWKWKPSKSGRYTLRMSVDDDGQEIPFINGKIPEKKEDNNSIEITIDVAPAGTFEFAIDQRKAYVTRLEYVVEEMPLVPVVFFEPASAKLDSESLALLDIYAERLTNNPNVNLAIEGFFDPSDNVACTSASELEIKRAEAVQEAILKRVPDLENNLRISNEISCVEPRYRINPSKVIRDKSLIAAENRRAELKVEFPNVDTKVAEYTLDENMAEVPNNIEIDKSIINILEHNQDAILIIEGGFTPQEDSTLGLTRAEKLREEIFRQNSALLPGKIRIFPGWDGPKIRVTLSGEGILWAPTTSLPSVVGFENLDPTSTKIAITPTDFERITVDSSRVDIVSPDNQLIRQLVSKKGLPPSKIEWDWRDEGGHLIKPESWVRIRVTTFNGKQQEEYVSSGKPGRMQVRVKDVQRRIHRLLVVQFVFDETVPTNHFLESRLDGLAHGMATEARAGLSPSVHLSGHTDAIGSENHNLKLSTRRANRELAILRLFLAHHLGIKSTSEVDGWLIDKNSTLDASGYGATEPYKLMAISPDGVELLLGNNTNPRGRTVNRRVTVEHGVDEDTLRK